MLLGNQGLVTQVNVKSSGNTVISPLSTSVGWASTGGMAVTSTGLSISSGGKIVLYTSTGLEGTKITDGTYTEAISSNSAMRAGIWDYPTAGIPVKNPTGVPLGVRFYDGTNYGPTMDAAARKGYVQLTDGTNDINPTVPATTINEYNITLTLANTEYSQALPANTKKFIFQARTDVDIRYAFTTGKVATPTAPYFTLKAGMIYSEDNLNLTSKTIYWASTTAGAIVELIGWT